MKTKDSEFLALFSLNGYVTFNINVWSCYENLHAVLCIYPLKLLEVTSSNAQTIFPETATESMTRM
jgi:hypothetical protein